MKPSDLQVGDVVNYSFIIRGVSGGGRATVDYLGRNFVRLKKASGEVQLLSTLEIHAHHYFVDKIPPLSLLAEQSE